MGHAPVTLVTDFVASDSAMDLIILLASLLLAALTVGLLRLAERLSRD